MRLLDVTKIKIFNRISNSLKLFFLSSRLIKKNFKTVTLYSNIIYTHRNIFQHIAHVCQTSTLNFIHLLKQGVAEGIEKEKDIPLSKDSFYIDILKKHESLINRICFYYASSKDEYEDLRQDTLINIWRGIPKYKGDCKISTWIYRICLNTCVTSWRKSKKRFNFDSLDSITEFADDSETDNEKIEQLHYLISMLSPDEKALIMLQLDESTYDEIADITGYNRNTVATKLKRIKEKLSKIANNQKY